VLVKYSSDQGDQMSLRKIRPNCGPTHFWSNLLHNNTVEKRYPEMWANSAIKKLPQAKQLPN
jgi:hypothetical protein